MFPGIGGGVELWQLDKLPLHYSDSGSGGRRLVGDSFIFSYITVAKGEFIPDHTHPYDQLTWCVEGVIRMKCAGRTLDVPAGTIIKVPAGVLHSAEYLTKVSAVEIGLGRDPGPAFAGLVH